jgi:UDP-N-acetylglucosamine 2-epimerase (non-hydrolysing)
VTGPAPGGKRLKVMTIVGTRPELIKLSRVIVALDRHTDHVLVHSGQNYDPQLNEVFFRELEIPRPRHYLGVAGGSVAETIAQVVVKSDEILAAETPDALLIYGDTNTCLCVLAAKRRKVPIFHMEAGNRCFDQRVPEELNRKVVDHLSDVNMPLTEHARRYLLAEGLRPELTIKTGSTMREVLDHYEPGIARSRILEELGLAPRGYLVVSAHREENVDDPARLAGILDTLRAVARRYARKIVVSTHPRTRVRLEMLAEQTKDLAALGITFLKPFGFLDYVHLQKNAFCVISDSGTVTEESALVGFPAVTLREAHERPEGMDAGTLVMSGLRTDRVLQAIEVVTSRDPSDVPGLPPDYLERNVSRKVVQIIQSYTSYVNRTIWQKTASEA